MGRKKTVGTKKIIQAKRKRLNAELGRSAAVTDAPRDVPGRPLSVIDPRTLAGLAAIDCSYEEMAAVLGVSEETIRDNPENVALVNKERLAGNMSLRRVMMTGALAGNASLLIWLSKTRLGMIAAGGGSDGAGSTRDDAPDDTPLLVVTRNLGELPTSAGVQVATGAQTT